jgi:myo-inositol catabolism protein IolS
MKSRPLGRSGFDVSVLTFGCWQAGGAQWNNTNDDDSLGAMRAAFEAGITFFDTAEAYGEGHSEELVGRFLNEVGKDAIRIATKVNAPNLAPDKVKTSCENSLKRLGLECVDLYQIHWPSGTWDTPIIPIGDTMSALLQLQQEGKIRAIGVSNFTAQQIEEAEQFGRIDSLQPPYSLFFQPFVQNGTLDYCQKNSIGVIPYSPLAQGLVSGKFTLDNRPTDNRAGNHLFKDPTYALALESVEKMKPIAQKYNANTLQVALAWLIAQPGVTSPIVGARTPEQIQGAAKAAELELEQSDLEAVSRLAAPVLESLPDAKTNPWM